MNIKYSALLISLLISTGSQAAQMGYKITCSPAGKDSPTYSAEVETHGSHENHDGLIQYQGVKIGLNGGEPVFQPDAVLYMRGVKPEDIISVLFSIDTEVGLLTRNCPTGSDLNCPSMVDPISGEAMVAECKTEMTYASQPGTRSMPASPWASSTRVSTVRGGTNLIGERIQCISEDQSIVAEISEFYLGVILVRRLHRLEMNGYEEFSSLLGKILPGSHVTIGEELTVRGFSDRLEFYTEDGNGGTETTVANCLR